MESQKAPNQPKAPGYRRAKPLPFELARHCNIYFEEKLCKLPPVPPQWRVTNTRSVLCRPSSSPSSPKPALVKYYHIWPCFRTDNPPTCSRSNSGCSSLHHHSSKIAGGCKRVEHRFATFTPHQQIGGTIGCTIWYCIFFYALLLHTPWGSASQRW